MRPIYDWEQIQALKDRGLSWAEIVSTMGYEVTPKSLSTIWSNRRRDQERFGAKPAPEVSEDAQVPTPNDDDIRVTLIDGETLDGIKGEEDLIRLFKLDPERWEMVQCWVGGKRWDMLTSRDNVRTGHSYRMTAQFRLRQEVQVDLISRAFDQMWEDAESHAPPYEAVTRAESFSLDGDPVAYTVHVYDPHLGMLAWGEETGRDQDLKIASSDYVRAHDYLLSLARLYPVEEIVIVAGHDLGHASGYGLNQRGGVTAAGTPQDMDTRMEKIFTTVRKALIQNIDKARLIAKVRAIFVPGNHDRPEVYRWGEVIAAWYRNDPEVTVEYGARKRRFYNYGANTLMLTHGEEYRRIRDSLPLIMATECPPEWWMASHEGYREVLTGHNHIKIGGRYVPTYDEDETRAIRTRSLPGLTSEDAWHYDQGYKHFRSATAIAYRRSGGIAGLHEIPIPKGGL